MSMLDKFNVLEERLVNIERQMSNPDVINDPNQYNELNKKRLELEEPVGAYLDYKKLLSELEDAKEMMASSDEEMRELAHEEFERLKKEEEIQKQDLLFLLVPVDPNDKKNVYLEIRSGTGGEEAALFARDVFEMYQRYAQNNRWKVEIIDFTEADAGGFAKVIAFIKGEGVYSRLKFESGIHRVQRVPSTEASGRIHTSAASVAILPEADDVNIHIDPKDLKIDTYRASGAGGQHVNKTDSAVRITHVPTGIVVTCQDDRSQHKNKDKAMKLLKSKLWEAEEERRFKEEAQARKSQVGSGDRSEKIRTYNYPQGRVTDHRIGLTLYKLEYIMQGDIDEIIDALIAADRIEKLKAI